MWFHIQIESVNILQTVVIDWLCVNQISILHATNRSNAKTSKQLKITDIKSLYALWCRSQHIVNAYIAYFDGNYIIMTFCDFQFLSSFFHFFFSPAQCVLVWRLHLMQPDLQFNVSVIVSSLFAISVFSICHKSLTFYSQSSANPFQTSSFANFVNQRWLMLLNHCIDVKQPKHVL